ncbi:metallochaperone AztD [Wenxinia saemankumensis]|uniref:Zinc transport system substrate-binding protein n=1 Tax=Wenxinia saemankumensis TaxID=1447782 RepID=A0A1M6B668_9RHOB|nr:metallochaperone AztD [Wenxinia saemankumensis]SHI43973.1 hypothetical protein SAMN05444417_0790 [Wenxinia saemankumensis]
MRPIPLSAALLAATVASPAMAQDEEATLWRLFVADQATGTVTALDLDAPENRWTFELGGPARLYPTASGEAVVAVQSDDDRVDFLSSGIALDGHGDHADIRIEDPAQIEGNLTGPRPFHVVTHDGISAINFDRGGYATFLGEDDILAGSMAGAWFEQAHAHHGFATPFGEWVVSSVASDEPVEEGELPPRAGLQVFTPGGEPVGEMQTCTDLHGEAISGDMLVAGCADGIATVRIEDGAPVTGLLPYPDDASGESTGHLLGARAMQIFLGDYGDDTLLVISPEEQPAMIPVELPYREVDTIFDPARPQYAYVFTEDGPLHRLNLLSAEIEDSRQVTQPYSMDGHWRDPRPRLALADDRIVLTDPNAAVLRVLEAGSLDETGTIPLRGLPYNIIAIGGSGLTH